MTKEDILTTLKEAKASHVRWHACGQALAMGSESCKKDIPISHHECEFGKWYYSTGQLLKFSQNFASIENVHEKLHLIYENIYEKSVRFNQKGILANQELSNTKKGKEMERLCGNLRQASKRLMEEIIYLENEISIMSPLQISSKMMEKKYKYII